MQFLFTDKSHVVSKNLYESMLCGSGRGLNDSPVGLAAYILEKFSTWTSKDFRNLEDGGLTRYTKYNSA